MYDKIILNYKFINKLNLQLDFKKNKFNIN